jgi:hypothetical protein
MTIRRHKSGRSTGPVQVSPDDFPALARFFGGYFHQDLVPVHGSANRATQAFAADADAADREAVRQELHRLIALVGTRGPAALRRAVRALGAAWTPATLGDVESLLAHLHEPDKGGSGTEKG